MTSILYYIIIYPIELVLDIVFHIIHSISNNPGIAIIGVSLVINIFLLPLYRRADLIQAEEGNRQEKMARWVSHIKDTFKGDERVMMLSAYYKIENYHPLYALRSSISLMLQIPFFLAAYNFLANLALLQGTAFLFINDLSKPDGLMKFGSVNINILPIAMTLINFISTAVYTKGKKFKDNIQIYVMAVVFLILLYNSPSGMVLYWTMNNIFSLLKNLIMKNPVRKDDAADRSMNMIYLGSIAVLTLLMGVLIPSALISASPQEFVQAGAFRDPLTYVISTFCIAFGSFCLWLTIFYLLSSNKTKKVFCIIIWLIAGLSTVNYLFFGKHLGTLSEDLTFDNTPVYSVQQCIINIGVLIVLAILMALIWKRKRNIIPTICLALCLCFAAMSGINSIRIERQISRADYLPPADKDFSFPISKHGKNVVVIMLDRAIGGYIPFIMNEKPELKETFSGFTFFPNTVSFGRSTNFGAPALFGGYEYTPYEINKRDKEKLVDKHNEALLVMPVLFSEEGYEATVYDPPYAGYQEWPDLSIFDDYPDIRAFHQMDTIKYDMEYYSQVEQTRRRSFFMYSVFKTAPVVLQPFIYDERTYGIGQYLAANEAIGVPWNFYLQYSMLSSIPDLTRIEDSDKNTFMYLDNNTTHEPTELQLPDYLPTLDVNNTGMEDGIRVDADGNILKFGYKQDDAETGWSYHVNMAALLKLGEWLELLKKNGVYDNTRIIIVADHGFNLGDFPNMILEDGTDTEQFNPLLMFKDFGTKEFITSNEFMTNGDTPALATKGIIDDPKNPFTDNKIDSSAKERGNVFITDSNLFSVESSMDKTVFDTSDAPWYSVHDNIFDKKNWKKIEDPSGKKQSE
ncbi:MAG: membrane protein insertase YidC [Lachnospiraceae bacterium]|nr:membrane protein insertase YidC [Lachnospiraceae bacterium]